MAGIAKRYPASVASMPKRLLPALGVLFAGTMFLQAQLDPQLRELRKGEAQIASASGNLNNEFLLLPLLGFREAAAGLLWVRCDEFFHSGDYDAILPLVRLITWLDPHTDNVYITGAWHLAYNFTDASERSDRRYLVPAHELLKEGIVNNPRIPDISFELGWQNYDKVKNYALAEKSFRDSLNTPVWKGSDDYPYGAPLKTNHILAHTLSKRGRIPEAIEEWANAMKRSAEMQQNNKDISKMYSLTSMQAAEANNHKMLFQRYADRYTASGHSNVNPSAFPMVLLPPPGSPNKTPRPWDMSFAPQVEAVRPKVLKVKGKMNIADGARVDVRLTDWDYDEREAERKKLAATRVLEKFEVDNSQTILVDMISVRKNRFEREMDMSQNPKMYSFSQQYYRLTLSFNPRSTSPHVQDRHGYSGEGLIDKEKNIFIDRREDVAGTKMIEGQAGDPGAVWDGKTLPFTEHKQPVRMIKVVYKLSRDQIMGLRPITDADIIPNNTP